MLTQRGRTFNSYLKVRPLFMSIKTSSNNVHTISIKLQRPCHTKKIKNDAVWFQKESNMKVLKEQKHILQKIR